MHSIRMLIAAFSVAFGAGAPVVAQEYAAIYERLKAEAEAGDLDAAYELGVLYHLGHRASQGGPEQDHERGIELWEQVAQSGDARAQWRMGRAYQTGSGVDRDRDLAYSWMRASADQGNAHAMEPLGSMYLRGHGTSVDEDEAYRLFSIGAQEGRSLAMVRLGRMYRDEGVGPTDDLQQALHWFERAAELNDPNGVRDLSNAYLKGTGVEASKIDALRVYVEYEGRTGRELPRTMLRILAEMTEEEIALVDTLYEDWLDQD